MKFKKGKLYRVFKDVYEPSCAGCVLKYKGVSKGGNHVGIPVKSTKHCYFAVGDCTVFQAKINTPNNYEIVEYIDMVKFCKKLRKERKNG